MRCLVTRTNTFSSWGNSINWCSQQWTSTISYGMFTSSSNTNKARGKKGTTSAFNLLIFDTVTVILTTEVECTTMWTKHLTCLTSLWNNLYIKKMVVCNTRLLYSQTYCTISINIVCWILHIEIGSCFESNHNRFRIGM